MMILRPLKSFYGLVLEGSFGAANVKLPGFDFGRARFGYTTPSQHSGIRTLKASRQLQYVNLALSHKAKQPFRIPCISSSETVSAQETESSSLKSQLFPNSSEIKSLVSDICDTTSVAEFELKLGEFRLYLTRDIEEKSKSTPPVPPPVSVPAPAPAPAPAATHSNGSVSSTALVISKRSTSPRGIQSFIDEAVDEGLVMVESPRVGYFQRSRVIKGRRTRPFCEEKQMVKEGQVICYIGQLGGQIPVEADVSGEVVKILRKDGDPVGYGDALIAILPSFPGIKKLQ